MNFILWILQVLLGLAFVAAGFNHGFRAEQMKSQPGGQWVAAVPPALLAFIALFEFLGGIGVFLPAVTGILPWLTSWAATGLALLMLLAAVFHLIRGEYANIVFNLVLLVLAAFVAYGLCIVVPF